MDSNLNFGLKRASVLARQPNISEKLHRVVTHQGRRMEFVKQLHKRGDSPLIMSIVKHMYLPVCHTTVKLHKTLCQATPFVRFKDWGKQQKRAVEKRPPSSSLHKEDWSWHVLNRHRPRSLMCVLKKPYFLKTPLIKFMSKKLEKYYSLSYLQERLLQFKTIASLTKLLKLTEEGVLKFVRVFL